MRLLVLLFCLNCAAAPAFAGQSTRITITPAAWPAQSGQQSTFTSSFPVSSAAAAGVKPVWSVKGAAATFIYADSTQTKVHVSIPTQPTAYFVELTVTATIPETPQITVKEVQTILVQ